MTEITDQFLWPKQERDLKTMRMFAIDFLSDVLGAEQLGKCIQQHVNEFVSYVCYVINREIDLNDHLNKYSLASIVVDGTFDQGACTQIGQGEQFVQIYLNLPMLCDTFTWDISNPDNQPETFACEMVRDLGLEPVIDYSVAITYEIRK